MDNENTRENTKTRRDAEMIYGRLRSIALESEGDASLFRNQEYREEVINYLEGFLEGYRIKTPSPSISE